MAPELSRPSLLWIIMLGIVDVVHHANAVNPCQSAIRTLGCTDRRDVDYVLTDEALCDRDTIVQGSWYRVSPNDNVKMSERCPELFRCGTVYPIWVNGSHPTDDSIVQIKVFIRWDNNCSYWPTNVDNLISVKRCPAGNNGYYFIYKLINPPVCSTAFCTEMFMNMDRSETSTSDIITTTPTTTTITSRSTSYTRIPANKTASLSTTAKTATSRSTQGSEISTVTNNASTSITTSTEMLQQTQRPDMLLTWILGPVSAVLVLVIITVVIVIMYKRNSMFFNKSTRQNELGMPDPIPSANQENRGGMNVLASIGSGDGYLNPVDYCRTEDVTEARSTSSRLGAVYQTIRDEDVLPLGPPVPPPRQGLDIL